MIKVTEKTKYLLKAAFFFAISIMCLIILIGDIASVRKSVIRITLVLCFFVGLLFARQAFRE